MVKIPKITFCTEGIPDELKQRLTATRSGVQAVKVHIIVIGKISKAIKKESLEVYSQDRFFTVTGDHVEEIPLKVCEAQDLLEELEAKYGDKTHIRVQLGKIWKKEKRS